MTSVTSYYSGNYYSLSSSSQGQGNATSNAATSAAALLSAQSAQTTTLADETSASSAYQLSLSPEAQAYIASLNSGSSSSTAASSTSSDITLTSQQAQQIKDIVLKYKDAPFTQDTFNQIQDDLRASGLGADQLAAQQEMSQFNPTSIFLDALNGVDTSGEVQSSDQLMSDVNSIADSYMKKVQTLWQSVSTTAPASDAASATTES